MGLHPVLDAEPVHENPTVAVPDVQDRTFSGQELGAHELARGQDVSRVGRPLAHYPNRAGLPLPARGLVGPTAGPFGEDRGRASGRELVIG